MAMSAAVAVVVDVIMVVCGQGLMLLLAVVVVMVVLVVLGGVGGVGGSC